MTEMLTSGPVWGPESDGCDGFGGSPSTRVERKPSDPSHPSLLTPPRQDFTATAMVSALETTWSTIRANHPEIPAVVLVLSPTRTKLGHYAEARWQHGADRLSEVLVSAEGLCRGAADVLVTLLHEGTHGLASARGVQDTSRGGRYHNRKFARVADELGLTAENDPRIGWSPCTLQPSTADRYRADLARLADAMTAFRHRDPTATKRPPASVTARCSCPRLIRLTRSVLDAGLILCDCCGSPFKEGTS